MPDHMTTPEIISDLGDVLVSLREVEVYAPEKAHRHKEYQRGLQILCGIVRDLAERLEVAEARIHLLESCVGADFMAGLPSVDEDPRAARSLASVA